MNAKTKDKVPKYVFKKAWKRVLVGLIDLAGSIAFFPFRPFRRTPVPKKILVLRLDQIGDVVQTIPFFKRLRLKYPEAEIHALVTKDSGFLLNKDENVDKVAVVSGSWFFPERKTGFFTLLSGIKGEKYDLGFDLRGDIRNICLLWFAGVKKIVGYDCAGGGFLLDEKRQYDRDEHEIDKNLKLIDESPEEELRFDFRSSKEDEKTANAIIDGNDETRIVIHPFSRASSRMWGFERYRQLARKLSRDGNARIYIIGSKEEKRYADEFEWNDRIVNRIGKTNLGASIVLIRKADVFIGNNSALQYFAAYSGVRTCVICGYATNYERWLPKVAKENFIGFSIPVDCGPCESSVCNNEDGHICMESITVDMAYDALKKWL